MKNWKTALAGIAFGTFNLMANGMNWKQALVSAAAMSLGFVGKDKDVTGAGPEARRVKAPDPVPES